MGTTKKDKEKTTFQSLLDMSEEQLAGRYIVDAGDKTIKDIEQHFKEVISDGDESGAYKYTRLTGLNGANLRRIFTRLMEVCDDLMLEGYTLNAVNVISDFNKILKDNNAIYFEARKNPKEVHEGIDELIQQFVNELLIDKAIVYTLADDFKKDINT